MYTDIITHNYGDFERRESVERRGLKTSDWNRRKKANKKAKQSKRKNR